MLLFRALTGRMPFANEGNVFEQQPIDGVDTLPEATRGFAKVLLQAVAQNPADRFPTAEAFRAALLTAKSVDEPTDGEGLAREINPTVDHLRGLFRNSAGGNADNRGLDTDFARDTYVPTGLDERLLPAIFADRSRVVFLSGNPGDGKTAFLAQVQQALASRGAVTVAADESGWVLTDDCHTYRACYDASEAHEGQNADGQVRGRLAGLEGDAPAVTTLTVLVAINDGRLAAIAEGFAAEFGWLSRQIALTHDPATPREPGGVWLIDLKRRAYVGLQP